MENKTLNQLMELLPEVIERKLPDDHALYPGDTVNYKLDIIKENGSWKISYNYYGWEGVDDILPHYTPINEDDKMLIETVGFDQSRCGFSDPDLKAVIIKMLIWLENYGNN